MTGSALFKATFNHLPNVSQNTERDGDVTFSPIGLLASFIAAPNLLVYNELWSPREGGTRLTPLSSPLVR